MFIFLYTQGKNVLIGIKDRDLELKQFCLDSRLIFQNPSLFFTRFIKALNKIYPPTASEKDDNLSDIVFALSGKIDYQTGIVLGSKTLNNVAYPLNWEGFNFKKSFQYLPENKIHTISNSLALAFGLKVQNNIINLPALIVSVEEEIALSLINKDGSVEDLYWAGETFPDLSKTFEDLLTNPGLDDIIFSGATDIYEIYTDNIIQVFKSFLKMGQDSGIELKTIAFFSDKMDFIYTDRLINAFSGIHVIIPDEHQKASIPLKGCLEYLRSADEKTSTITHIEYWVRDNKVYNFSEYNELIEHFRGAKTIANPENEYRVYYLSGRIKKLKMKYLDFEEQLKVYRF